MIQASFRTVTTTVIFAKMKCIVHACACTLVFILALRCLGKLPIPSRQCEANNIKCAFALISLVMTTKPIISLSLKEKEENVKSYMKWTA
mmetsp:Transcript_19611/g.28737  ORF Transcript_19611/g.28737 Transcript_19611/m.28737 type:complete len:90 (+) Transcript_19611:1412-1681(+)